MHHAFGLLALKQSQQWGRLFNPEPMERKAVLLSKGGQSGPLEAHVVVVVEVVQAHDLVSVAKQASGRVHADEAGRAGDQDFHAVLAPATSC